MRRIRRNAPGTSTTWSLCQRRGAGIASGAHTVMSVGSCALPTQAEQSTTVRGGSSRSPRRPTKRVPERKSALLDVPHEPQAQRGEGSPELFQSRHEVGLRGTFRRFEAGGEQRAVQQQVERRPRRGVEPGGWPVVIERPRTGDPASSSVRVMSTSAAPAEVCRTPPFDTGREGPPLLQVVSPRPRRRDRRATAAGTGPTPPRARSPCQNQKSMWSLYGRLSGEKRVSRLIRKIDPSTRGSARIPGASRSSAGRRAMRLTQSPPSRERRRLAGSDCGWRRTTRRRRAPAVRRGSRRCPAGRCRSRALRGRGPGRRHRGRQNSFFSRSRPGRPSGSSSR